MGQGALTSSCMQATASFWASYRPLPALLPSSSHRPPRSPFSSPPCGRSFPAQRPGSLRPQAPPRSTQQMAAPPLPRTETGGGGGGGATCKGQANEQRVCVCVASAVFRLWPHLEVCDFFLHVLLLLLKLRCLQLKLGDLVLERQLLLDHSLLRLVTLLRLQHTNTPIRNGVSDIRDQAI